VPPFVRDPAREQLEDAAALAKAKADIAAGALTTDDILNIRERATRRMSHPMAPSGWPGALYSQEEKPFGGFGGGSGGGGGAGMTIPPAKKKPPKKKPPPDEPKPPEDPGDIPVQPVPRLPKKPPKPPFKPPIPPWEMSGTRKV